MGKRGRKRRKRERSWQQNQPQEQSTLEVSNREGEESGQDLQLETISSRGKKTIGGGIGVLVLGFFVLTLTDPQGQNWASTLSPLLILGAYAIIAVGIFLPEEEKPTQEEES